MNKKITSTMPEATKSGPPGPLLVAKSGLGGGGGGGLFLTSGVHFWQPKVDLVGHFWLPRMDLGGQF